MSQPARATWVELDLGALSRNVAAMVRELGGVPLMVVVKAQAYGHGAVPVARAALAAGASRLAAATLDEALELRHAGLRCPVLVLGHTPVERMAEAVAEEVALTVFEPGQLTGAIQAGTRPAPARIHLKVDTGMSRLGFPPEGLEAAVAAAESSGAVILEGVCTHFRKGQDDAATKAQLERFLGALAQAEAAGPREWLRHAGSSAAWRLPAARLDLVRSGIEVLGMVTPDGRRREPVLSWHARVVQVRTIEAGTHVSYGDSFTARQRMQVATLPVGYADGFRRGPRHWGSVLLGGVERPLLGDVTMDMTMVDVSQPPQVDPGALATLIGRQGQSEISAEEAARRLGTINYEVTTQISGRVPRVERAAD
ncbi:MAG: alanine racemase [Candidatus Dormibacteria bacterium]